MNLEQLITKTYNCFIHTYKLTAPIILVYCIFYIILSHIFKVPFDDKVFEEESLLYLFNMNNFFFLCINIILGIIIDVLMIKIIIHFHTKNNLYININEILRYVVIFLKLLIILYILPILIVLLLPYTAIQMIVPLILIYYIYIIILFFTTPYLIIDKMIGR